MTNRRLQQKPRELHYRTLLHGRQVIGDVTHLLLHAIDAGMCAADASRQRLDSLKELRHGDFFPSFGTGHGGGGCGFDKLV